MAQQKKQSEDLLNQRIIFLMSKAELDMIDDWRFANRLRSRAEAIRRLVASGMAKNIKGLKDARGSRAVHDAISEDQDDR